MDTLIFQRLARPQGGTAALVEAHSETPSEPRGHGDYKRRHIALRGLPRLPGGIPLRDPG